MRRDLDELIGLINDRGLGGDPVIRQRIAALKIGIEALRFGALRALSQQMKVGIPGPEGSLAKWQWANMNQSLTELAVDVLGPEALEPGLGVGVPSPALARQLDRGRHDRRDEEHHRRARPRFAQAPLSFMDFGFNDEQQAIKATAREMLAKRSPFEKVRGAAEARAYDDALWAEIRALGWPGIAIGEEHGGQGLGTVELAILCEELGYACAPTPFISNASAGLFIDQAGSDEQRQRWLPGIASGEERGSAAFEPRENDLVPDAQGAVVLVLHDGEATTLVAAGEADIEPIELVDATRSFARVSASGSDPLPGDVEAAVDRSLVAVAAELTGVAQRAMEMAIDYAKERQQFDRPIGAYQAVSHRCAGMLYDVEEARSLTYYAAWCADDEPDSLPLASLDGQGPGLRRRLEGDERRAPGARRHRLHLGARPPLPAQAGEGRRRVARRHAHASRARREAGRHGCRGGAGLTRSGAALATHTRPLEATS